ncbi:MAG: VWA domain-containing protein [Pseudomonadota bacterium]|nr:VWA domain-containing protein [Pseudomonadota bacterium]
MRRGRLRAEAPTEAIAPHLRRALTVGGDGRGRLRAIDGAAAVFALAALGAAGAAGPAWTRAPAPFAAQAVPAVVILKVARSMEAADVAPSRLERGKQEIRDVLDRRAGARRALAAYAGSAHAVVPKTGDAAAMVPFLDALTPEVMPVDGDRAAEALAPAAGLSAAATLASGAARTGGRRTGSSPPTSRGGWPPTRCAGTTRFAAPGAARRRRRS